MQVSIEETSSLERRLTVGIPAAVVDSEVDKRLKEAAKTVRINGFRKGKVPLTVVKKRYGAGVRQEVLGDTINRSFVDAVQKEGVRPAGQPSIEPKQIDAGKDIEFIATFEVYPEVEVKDLGGVSITKLDAEIQDSDIDEMIETLRKSQADWVDAERAAADGDQATIDFVGTKDGEAFEGGTANDQPIVIGSKSMIPGFEDGLIGLSAGDEKVLELTFPEDYQAEELKGAAVEFKVTVKKVAGKDLPELDDAFFERFGVAEGGIEKFKEEVKSNMLNEKEKSATSKLKGQVFDALAKANPVDVPKALVKSEIDALRQQTMQQYGQLSDKLDVSTLFPDDLFREQAESRAVLGLLVSEIVKQDKLVADKDKVKAMIEKVASTYEDPQSVVNHYYSNEQLLSGVEAAVLEEQVVDKLLESATVVEKSVSYQELINPESDKESSDSE